MTRRLLPCVLLCFALTACTDGPDLPDPDEVELNGECPLDERHGGFVVERYDSYSIVQGQIATGVVPITVLEEVRKSGECQLLKRNNPVCDPQCSAGQTCDFDGTCIDFPTPVDLGVVLIEGLTETHKVEPVQPGNNYFLSNLTHPAFQPEDTIRVSLNGDWEDKAMLGVGIDPLVVASEALTIVRGQDLVLNWTAPEGTPRAEIKWVFNIDQHGNSPASVHCTFADTGSGTVPAEIIDALLDAGVSGYPNGRLTRRTVDSVRKGEACADLIVGAPVSADVRVDGVTPCERTEDCDPGQRCHPTQFICE